MIANGFVTALPIIISSLVALFGVYLSIQLRRDTKKKDKDKERLDTLVIGQEWVVAALDRAEKENERLRDHVTVQQREFDEAIKGWQRRVEEQEDEIIALKLQVDQCTNDCRELREKLERKP